MLLLISCGNHDRSMAERLDVSLLPKASLELLRKDLSVRSSNYSDSIPSDGGQENATVSISL